MKYNCKEIYKNHQHSFHFAFFLVWLVNRTTLAGPFHTRPPIIPFFFFSTAISSPSSRRQMILGVGKPSARHVMLMFWFSRTATEDGVLSMSSMLGGTATKLAWGEH